MELVDSSAWIEYLRDTGSHACNEIDRLLRAGPASVATTEPLVMELLAGAVDAQAFAKLDKLTSGIRLLPVDGAVDYRTAAIAYRAVRARGDTVRRLLDCLIAAVAARTGAVLVHRDRDFDRLDAVMSDLRVRSLL